MVFLHQAFDLRPLGYVNCYRKSISATGLNVLHNRVETIFTPRPQNDRRSQFRKVASGALSEAAACTGNDGDFPSMFLLMVFSFLLE